MQHTMDVDHAIYCQRCRVLIARRLDVFEECRTVIRAIVQAVNAGNERTFIALAGELGSLCGKIDALEHVEQQDDTP